MSLPCLDGLFMKCRVLGRKGTLEGTPRSPHPGVGSARAPDSLAGTPGKSPLSTFSAPHRHKAGAGSAGSSRLSIPTFGVRPRAERLSIIFRF